MMSKRIEILIPDRIGDALLSLPALVCLKQLQQTYQPAKDIVTLYVPAELYPILAPLNLFETRVLTFRGKIQSWFQPAEQAVFLYSSHDYLGFRALETYGWQNPFKKLVRFTHHLAYLKLEHCERELPTALVTFLKDRFGFSLATIRYFGICLTLGYSVEQILEVFEWTPETLALPKPARLPVGITGPYMVFSVEAAYGSKREAQRRWPEGAFLALAGKASQLLGIPIVFIGLDTRIPLPQSAQFYDLRGKLSLKAVFDLLHHATAYVGNDSGPLHLANLAQVASFTVYLSTTPQTYGPTFPNLNHALQNPDSLEPAMAEFEAWLQAYLHPHSNLHACLPGEGRGPGKLANDA